MTWTGWVTGNNQSDGSRRFLPITPAAVPWTRSLTVNPSDRHQTWLGVGASLTDASVGLLRGRMKNQRLLFDPAAPDGAQINLVRLPLSGTDFRPSHWAWAWDDSRQMASPPVAARSAMDVLRSIMTQRTDLAVVGTAWSAPAEFKDSRSLAGGSLLQARESAYADLLVAQAEWLQAQGVPLRAMTLGNEPGLSDSTYPTMHMSPEQMVRLGQASPRLRTIGVDLWAHDHNWQDRDKAEAVLRATSGVFTAVAFHCYGETNPGLMAGLVDADGTAVPPVITECTGTDDSWEGTFRWDAVNLVTKAAQAGSTGLLMWNLALDSSHGPRNGGHA